MYDAVLPLVYGVPPFLFAIIIPPWSSMAWCYSGHLVGFNTILMAPTRVPAGISRQKHIHSWVVGSKSVVLFDKHMDPGYYRL